MIGSGDGERTVVRPWHIGKDGMKIVQQILREE